MTDRPCLGLMGTAQRVLNKDGRCRECTAPAYLIFLIALWILGADRGL